MQLNIPILLTLLRIFLVPFFVLVFYLPVTWAPVASSLIFIVAAITDWFDGFLARRLQQTTRFGAFLDPVADKVIVATALVLVAVHYHTWWITLPSTIMIAREIIISALREWMAEIGKSHNIAVSWLGKVKTVAQMVALVALLWRPVIGIERLGFIALYVATLLTFCSMLHYLQAAHQQLIALNLESIIKKP